MPLRTRLRIRYLSGARIPLLEIKLRSEMSKRALAEVVQDEQPELKKALTTTSSVKPIRLCVKCKSIAAVVSTSLSKNVLDGVATEEATSNDVCSCLCHVLYKRMKAR